MSCILMLFVVYIVVANANDVTTIKAADVVCHVFKSYCCPEAIKFFPGS